MDNLILILGAGFSYSGGLPLTKDLFNEIPDSPFTEDKKKYERVQNAWKQSNCNSTLNTEQWIKNIFIQQSLPFENGENVTWDDVLDFLLARLVKIPKGSHSHYFHGITTSVLSEIHRNFWMSIRSKYSIKNIITTNYDILIEQGLKTQYSKHRQPPICYYGGHNYFTSVRKMRDLVSRKHDEIHLGHEIELLKLHGSLNWVEEPHGFKIHEDVRAVFRQSRELGRPDIIPPLEEKERPEWASRIWRRAEKALKEHPCWFVCGYSFPEYDSAINEMISKCANTHKNLKIIISDPYNENVRENLQKIVPVTTTFELLPGLPELLTHSFLNGL